MITPYPLVHGCVVRCRALGLLNMEDEGGGDAKARLLAEQQNKKKDSETSKVSGGDS